MRTVLWLVVLAAAGCHGPARVPARPLGARDHLVEAQRHDEDARAHELLAQEAEQRAATTPVICGDRALADQATSGGDPLVHHAPCWTSEAAAVERHRVAAARLRVDADAHRARARTLVVAELEACAGLAPAETDHSPFDHREDLAAVEAELDGAQLRGARVRFARVPGLTVDWLGRALACHAAQAAMIGYDAGFLPACPAVVAGAVTTVVDEDGALVVVIRADDPAAALTIYARAEALLAPPAERDHRGGL